MLLCVLHFCQLFLLKLCLCVFSLFICCCYLCELSLSCFVVVVVVFAAAVFVTCLFIFFSPLSLLGQVSVYFVVAVVGILLPKPCAGVVLRT